MSASDQADLLRLSRDQLKRLCKERGHTGYSKCTKPQLVVLLGSDTPSRFNPSTMTTMLPPKQDTHPSAPVSKKRLEPDSSGPRDSVAKKQKRPDPIPAGTPSIQSPTIAAPSKVKRQPPFAQKLPTTRESFVPPVSITPTTIHPPSLPPASQLLPSSASNRSLGLPRPPELNAKPGTVPNLQPHSRTANEQESGTSFPTTDSPRRPNGGNGSIRAFKKFLDPRNGATSGHLAPREPQDTPASPCNMSVEPLPSPYLDFSVLPAPVLRQIGMPPSIPEKVHPWSIILSGISDVERRVCILVSRMFRYAGKSALRSISLGYLTSAPRQSICLPQPSYSLTFQANDWKMLFAPIHRPHSTSGRI